MSLLEWGNLGATLLTFGCFSFATTSFGGKLGRVSGFKNTSGHDYISTMTKEKMEALYDEVVKVASKDAEAPEWAKEKGKLKDWCTRYEKSLKHWANTSKYCLIQNTVRHKLVADGIKLKTPTENPEGTEPATADKCTENLLNAYADGPDSYHYLLGKKHCEDKSEQTQPAGAEAVATG